MAVPPILVVGATGRIGRVLRRCWSGGAAPGPVLWQARGPVPAGRDAALNWAIFDPLTDAEIFARAARGQAAILCLAGVIPGRGGDVRDNARLACAAVQAAAGTGARVLLTSSAAVYGDRAGVLRETDMSAPASAYGRAKAEMEACAGDLGARLGVPVCALRIGNVAGLDAALGGWRPGFALDRFPDGRTPVRSYIGPVELARILATLCTATDLPGVLNVAAPGPVEMGMLLDIAGLAWSPRPAPAGATAEVCLSTDRLARHADLAAPGDLARMVAEYRRLGPYICTGEAGT